MRERVLERRLRTGAAGDAGKAIDETGRRSVRHLSRERIRRLVVLASLGASATASADPIQDIVRDRIGWSLPAGLGVAKLHLPASLERLDIDPEKVVVEPPRNVQAGRSSFKVIVRGRGVFVPVSIAKLVEVGIARHALASGTVITDADITIEQRAIETIVPAPGAALVGATVTRDIAVDAAIALRDVSFPPPLARGTQVAVEIRRGGVRVRGNATLELAARAGQSATARLAHTRTVVHGTLRAPATLVVGESTVIGVSP